MGEQGLRIRLWSLPMLVVALAVGACSAPPPPRNVLLIVIDTLRADHLGVYGYERETSPEIDRWAKKGVVFERAYATSSWTVPSVGSMLTGLLPAQHGGGFPIEGRPNVYQRTRVGRGVTSIAELLRAEGFSTLGIVNNPFLKPHFGLAEGFDTYHYDEEREGAAAAVRRAAVWMEEHGDGPFFVLTHFMEPHLPYRPPAPFRGRFTGEPEPRDWKKLPSLEELRRLGASLPQEKVDFYVGRYDEEIAHISSEIGRLLDGLGERWEDTLVILTSDHGEELLDHGSFDHGHTLKQELLQVPLILWAPELEAGRVAAPVSLLDLPPTILEALDRPVDALGPATLSRSLWELARGHEDERDGAIVAECVLFGRERKALIRWPYKLTLRPDDGSRRLVDLDTDPLEKRDLAAVEPDIADRMEAELRRHTIIVSSLGDTVERLDEETSRELEALGYVD